MTTITPYRAGLHARRTALIALSFAVCVSFSARAEEQRGAIFIAIDAPPAVYTEAVDINGAGEIVGRYYDGTKCVPPCTSVDGHNHAYLLSRGRFTTIDPPGSRFAGAIGINRHGDIVGRYQTADGKAHGFLLNEGTFSSIDFSNTYTSPQGINARGDIVGAYDDSSGVRHGFLLSNDGAFTPIDVPGAGRTVAWKINSAGEIAGRYLSPDGKSHVFLRTEDGEFTSLDVPGAFDTAPGAIPFVGMNSRGDIVSSYCRAAPCAVVGAANVHGFLWSEGKFTSIDFPNATQTASAGINSRGAIVGVYVDPNGVGHGYLRTADADGEIADGDSEESEDESGQQGCVFGAWATPVNMGPVINSAGDRNSHPWITKDGLSLYITTTRFSKSLNDEDIAVAHRSSLTAPWSAPVRLGPNVNTVGFNDSLPSVSEDGLDLYFHSPRLGGFGAADIYVSHRDDPTDDFAWQPAVNLGPNVNGLAPENGPDFFQANGTDYLYYVTQNTPGHLGSATNPNIVLSTRPTGSGITGWSAPVAVTELNSIYVQGRASIRRTDGLEMCISRINDPQGFGGTDIYCSTRPSPSSPWSKPVNLGPTINTPFNDGGQAFDFRGKTLYFYSDRPGGFGMRDLYTTTRKQFCTPTANCQECESGGGQ